MMVTCSIISNYSLISAGIESLIRPLLSLRADGVQFEHYSWGRTPRLEDIVSTPSNILTICVLKANQPADYISHQRPLLYLRHDLAPDVVKRRSPVCLEISIEISLSRFQRLIGRYFSVFIAQQNHRFSSDEIALQPLFRLRNPAADLTARQLQVLALVQDGLSNKRIARQLGLVEGTVKIHVSKILKSLGASNRIALLARARHPQGR